MENGDLMSMRKTIASAHNALDLAGAPAYLDGSQATLSERIAWLHGQLLQTKLIEDPRVWAEQALKKAALNREHARRVKAAAK